MNRELEIYISIDLNDIFVGTLYVENSRGKDIFSFKYDSNYIKKYKDYIIDPGLNLTIERQYLPDCSLFGFLEDVIPDRWGKSLLKRTYNRALSTYDYLTLISDIGRCGALRIKEHNQFVGISKNNIPSYIYLNKLEQSSINIENNLDNDILSLIEPGSSLGGARPKANIYSNENELFIAKFPSKYDDFDVELVECVMNDLATLCGINVPDHKLLKLSSHGSTLLLKRFDRDKLKRIPFISMMSMVGAKDGESSEYSYLDLINVLNMYSISPNEDKIELYKRLIFNVIIHNGDDHLRNHGLIRAENGWRLSPAFDLNPTFDKNSLSLSIDGETFDFNINKVKSVAEFFAIKDNIANELISNISSTIKDNFESLFTKYKSDKRCIEMFRNILS